MQTEVPKLVVDAIKAYPAARIPTELLTGLSSSDVVAKLYEAGLCAAGDEALKALIQSNPTAPLPYSAGMQARANRGFAVVAAVEKAWDGSPPRRVPVSLSYACLVSWAAPTGAVTAAFASKIPKTLPSVSRQYAK